MDIFGGDIDNFFNTEGELNENIRDENIEEPDEDNGDEGKTDEHGEPIKVEPKKRSVRRPQVNTDSKTKRHCSCLDKKNHISVCFSYD